MRKISPPQILVSAMLFAAKFLSLARNLGGQGMNSEFAITSTEFPYNMSSWCTEKALNTVEALVELVELHKSFGIGDDDNAREKLHVALWDATKILSFSCGASWSYEDPKALLDEGPDGLERLKIRYSLPSAELLRIETIRQLVANTRLLLDGERSPNRTQLHELFNSYEYIDDPIIDGLRDKLEQVTMGELAWDNFVHGAREELCKLDEMMNMREYELKGG